jgi:hypothetical protein
MIEKIKVDSEAIGSSTMWKSEASSVYNAFHMKSSGYGIPATSLSHIEYNDMQKPIVNSILPKM